MLVGQFGNTTFSGQGYHFLLQKQVLQFYHINIKNQTFHRRKCLTKNFRSPGSDDNPDPRLAKNKLAVLTGVISRYSIFYSVFLLQYVESSFDPGHIKVCKGVQRCIVKDPYYYETFTSKWKCTEIIFFSQQGLNKCAGPSPHGQAKRWINLCHHHDQQQQQKHHN